MSKLSTDALKNLISDWVNTPEAREHLKFHSVIPYEVGTNEFNAELSYVANLYAVGNVQSSEELEKRIWGKLDRWQEMVTWRETHVERQLVGLLSRKSGMPRICGRRVLGMRTRSGRTLSKRPKAGSKVYLSLLLAKSTSSRQLSA